jgi:hypothetical protein
MNDRAQLHLYADIHLKNAELLKLTVENMGQYVLCHCSSFVLDSADRLMFWAVDDKLYNVDGLTKNASEMVQNAIKRNIPQRDMSLLQDALYHVFVQFWFFYKQ